jgi:hypothetical protein
MKGITKVNIRNIRFAISNHHATADVQPYPHDKKEIFV